jgi:hypothetical protein
VVSAAQSPEPFAAARAAFEQVIAFTRQAAVDEITHGQLERELSTRMREVTRVLFQDHLDLREVREERATVPVADAEGISRNRIERHRRTGLDTVFGPVTVHRIAYRGDYVHDLHLLDASLNLPEVKASHGLARLAAIEAVRGSFAAATEHLRTTCGVRIGSRQVQDLVVHAAFDIEGFYAAASPVPAGPGTLLVLTFDGKGIVMRPDALREATAKAAAAKGANTYKTRLATGEKNGRKRMAEIAAVYDADPAVRTAADILPEAGQVADRQRGASRRRHRQGRLRPGQGTRPAPHPALDRAGGRRRAPDRAGQSRGQAPQNPRDDHRGLHPRHRVPVEGRVVPV